MRALLGLALCAVLATAVPVREDVDTMPTDAMVQDMEERAWEGGVPGMLDPAMAMTEEEDNGVTTAAVKNDDENSDDEQAIDEDAIDMRDVEGALPRQARGTLLLQAPGNEKAPLKADENDMTKRNRIGNIPEHLGEEWKMQRSGTKAKDPEGREDMKANPIALTPDPYDLTPMPLEADCDSPQVGEVDEQVHMGVNGVDMNTVHKTFMVHEQSNKSRMVPLERGSLVSEPDAIAARVVDQPEVPSESDPARRQDRLPFPGERSILAQTGAAATKRKTKCSRSVNGHDVMNSLSTLDDDCGMPEPIIPCETAGNTTLCVRRIELQPQPEPEAELMPQPPPSPNFKLTLAVEFVDFGVTRDITVEDKDLSIGQVVEMAGSEWKVDVGQLQLIRNAGADFTAESSIGDVDDAKQLIVYLKCTYREYVPQLIMPVPACPDLVVRNMIAKIEVPAFHPTILNKDYVHQVEVLSTDLVAKVVQLSQIDPDSLQKITYNGEAVGLDTPLEEIFFRSGSPFVLYPSEPCPSHTISASPSPTIAPSASPIPSPGSGDGDGSDGLGLHGKNKKRKMGVYDSYRHCKNSRGGKIQPPKPETVGLDDINDPKERADPDAPECDEDEMTPPEEDDDDDTLTNSVGAGKIGDVTDADSDESRRVVVKIVYDSDIDPTIEINVPIKIDVAKGIDLFDALRLASGRPHPYMEGSFNDTYPIDHYTPLKPLDLKDGDVIMIRDLDRPSSDTPLREFDIKPPKATLYDDNVVVKATLHGEDENVPPPADSDTPESPEEVLPEHAWEQPGNVGYEVYETPKQAKAAALKQKLSPSPKMRG